MLVLSEPRGALFPFTSAERASVPAVFGRGQSPAPTRSDDGTAGAEARSADQLEETHQGTIHLASCQSYPLQSHLL